MVASQVEALIERWMADDTFRSRMREAPVEAAASEGFVLTEEEQRALGQIDFSQSDEELARQTSFGS